MHKSCKRIHTCIHDLASDLYFKDSLRIVEIVKEISEEIVDELIVYGDDKDYQKILEIDKREICGDDFQKFDNFIKEYNLEYIKYLNEPIWELDLLTDYLLFKDAENKEFLVSNTFLNDYKIISDPKYIYLYAENLIMISKK